MVGNERDSQSRQAVEQRKAAGRDEDGRDRPVTVTNSRGQKKTLGADWHTQAQAGRTSESVHAAPRPTHTLAVHPAECPACLVHLTLR